MSSSKSSAARSSQVRSETTSVSASRSSSESGECRSHRSRSRSKHSRRRKHERSRPRSHRRRHRSKERVVKILRDPERYWSRRRRREDSEESRSRTRRSRSRQRRRSGDRREDSRRRSSSSSRSRKRRRRSRSRSKSRTSRCSSPPSPFLKRSAGDPRRRRPYMNFDEELRKHCELEMCTINGDKDSATLPDDTSKPANYEGFQTKIVFVINLSSNVSKLQMEKLFDHCGKIRDIAMYPAVDYLFEMTDHRVCFIKFSSVESTKVAVQLTGVPFVEGKALLVIPFLEKAEIPAEDEAQECVALGLKRLILGEGFTKLSGQEKVEEKLEDSLNKTEDSSPGSVIQLPEGESEIEITWDPGWLDRIFQKWEKVLV